MSEPRISYSGYLDTTPEAEMSALANVYRLILDSAKKRGRSYREGGPEDVKGRSESDFHANARIP
jgi:hypothetical protein